MGLLPDGDLVEEPLPAEIRSPTPQEIDSSQPPEPELTVRQALRTQAFWCIAFGHGFASMIILAIMSQLGLMMTEIGYSLQTVAWIVALYNFVALPFQFAGGYMGDRIPTKPGAVLVYRPARRSGGSYHHQHQHLYVLHVRRPVWHRIWRTHSFDYSHQGRVFRKVFLWQNSRYFHGADEHSPAHFRATSWVYARPVGRLPVGFSHTGDTERRRRDSLPNRPQAQNPRNRAGAGFGGSGQRRLG